jgi:hypothetical protein
MRMHHTRAVGENAREKRMRMHHTRAYAYASHASVCVCIRNVGMYENAPEKRMRMHHTRAYAYASGMYAYAYASYASV